MAIQSATKNEVLINSFLMRGNYYQSLSLDYEPEPDLKNIVNQDTTEKMGIYYRVMFQKPLPDQGWKIHISAIPSALQNNISSLERAGYYFSYSIDPNLTLYNQRYDEKIVHPSMPMIHTDVLKALQIERSKSFEYKTSI